MKSTFKPAWWLPGPHLQTLWNPLCRKPAVLERQRERLWLEDGDFLDLDWHGVHSAEAPLVLVLHGLTGSSSSHYVLGLQQALTAQGWPPSARSYDALPNAGQARRAGRLPAMPSRSRAACASSSNRATASRAEHAVKRLPLARKIVVFNLMALVMLARIIDIVWRQDEIAQPVRAQIAKGRADRLVGRGGNHHCRALSARLRDERG